MLRKLCLLLLTAFCVKSQETWDIAVITKHQLEFYLNGTKLYNERAASNLPQFNTLTYDAIYNNLLFANSQHIYKYDITSEKFSIAAQMASKRIGGIAFDPVKEILFWTDIAKKSIHSTSLMDIQIKQNGSSIHHIDKLLFQMTNDIPFHIAVDSCRGYIYWTNIYTTRPTIERARFNGTEKKVIVHDDIVSPAGLAIDQNTKKIYWADNKLGIHYSIESADLNGENRKNLFKGTHHKPTKPYSFTISNDFIYWVHSSNSEKAIWQLPLEGSQPTIYIDLSYSSIDEEFGIAANYLINEQAGQNECKALINLLQNNSKTLSNSFNIPKDVELFCVYGKKVIGESVCECTLGYIGERCDISVCYNFCVQGNCSLTEEGQAKCTCEENFVGERCEVDVCRGFCLNDGKCSLNEYNKPMCTCIEDHEGLRCETDKISTTTPEASIAEHANEATVPLYKHVDESSTQRPEANSCHNFCLNGGTCSLDQNVPVCHCSNNYNGSRCETLKEKVISLQRSEIDACYNYCLNDGYCSVDLDQNMPVCHCLKNYNGSRCEITIDQTVVCNFAAPYKHGDESSTQRHEAASCHNYCLNDGHCSMDLDQDMPVCHCLKNYNGSRCEIPIDQNIVCNFSAPYNPHIPNDSARSSTVTALSVLVTLLGVTCAGLIIVLLLNNKYQCKCIKSGLLRRPRPLRI